MNTLTIVVFACLAAFAVAKPSGLLSLGLTHGYSHGHLPLVGSSGIVGSHGSIGPTGVINGHGAIGPNGEHNSLHSATIISGPALHGAVVAGPAVHSAAVVSPSVHGLGLGIGHGSAVVGHTSLSHGAVVAPHSLGHVGLGHHGLW